MACYDCEDCYRSEYMGGKCERFEYNCPFRFIEQIEENKDCATIPKLKGMIKVSNNILKNLKMFNEMYDLEEDIGRLNFFIDELEEKISDELIEEYRNIISEEK